MRSWTRGKLVSMVVVVAASAAAVPVAGGASKGGAFKGKVQKPSFNVQFKLSKNARAITGFRAKVWMSCSGNRSPISHPDFLVVKGKIPVKKNGRFTALDDPNEPGVYEVKGIVRGNKASGKLRYSRGSASLYYSEYCTTWERRWTARKR